MAEVARPVREARRPVVLVLLYALPVLSALALATLLVGDILSAIETDEHDGSDLHHIFVFDLAWPVFLVSTALTVLMGAVALAAGRLRRDRRLLRLGAWSLGWFAVAVAIVVVAVATGLS